MQGIDLKQSSEMVKTEAAIIRTNLRLLNLIYNLPGNIAEAIHQIEINAVKKENFAKAQESGGIN